MVTVEIYKDMKNGERKRVGVLMVDDDLEDAYIVHAKLKVENEGYNTESNQSLYLPERI